MTPIHDKISGDTMDTRAQFNIMKTKWRENYNISTKTKIKTRLFTLSMLFNLVFEILARVIIQLKAIK